MRTGEVLVRRVVPDDNSCLFTAVGYVMERRMGLGTKLRGVVRDAVLADQDSFSEAVLGKSPEEYATWIMDPLHWGGAIELAILAKHYQTKIAALDVQTTRCDEYCQDEPFPTVALLIYNGLHYDALAAQLAPDLPQDADLTQFEEGTPLLEAAREAAQRLVVELHASRQFTDTANFTLRCQTCNQGLKGEKEAVQHGKETGHANFTEY